MQTIYVTRTQALNIASKMPFLSRGVWLLMIESGVRISDALTARNGDFDEKGFFHYKAHKTGKAGRAKISKKFISAYVNKSLPFAYLFPSTDARRLGEPITRQTVFRHVKNAASMCGYDTRGIAPHSARKSFAVQLYREEGLGKTMAALQHRDAATTLLYAMSDDPLTSFNKRVKYVEKKLRELETTLAEYGLILSKLTKERAP